VDARGNRCPTALNLINFDLQGAAEWRGGIAVGAIDPQTRAVTDNSILSKSLPVEAGINRVILRSLPQAGTISLHASSPGLKPATIQLTSTPFPTTDGCTKAMPDAGLQASLSRGPTPAGDSVTPTRKTVHIAGATAGSNPDQVSQAFDDNDASSWKSDGQPGTGWIQFELERPATLSELTLKLGGFRNKSYPLRVTVDGKEVFAGYTKQSLGYTTLPLKPVQGKSIRIDLAGPIVNQDKFGLVEVSGKKLTEGSAGGVLEVIEAEAYEPLRSPVQ